MNTINKGLALCTLALACASAAPAQVLGKLKSKSEQKAGEAIDNLFGGKKKKSDSGSASTGTNSDTSGDNSAGSGPANKSGAGLTSTPPDVKQNLDDAESAYKKNSFGEARYAVQQAMLGVELEIGNKILESLPENISTLKKNDATDQVTSTGYGWAGLTIMRKYNDSNEKELSVTVANNAMWMSAVNTYLASGGYAQQTGGEQSWKQTKVKGYRAIIEYDENSGYKLSVPIGQSSLLVYEAVNFATESEVMTAASSIDIDAIKKQLGEN